MYVCIFWCEGKMLGSVFLSFDIQPGIRQLMAQFNLGYIKVQCTLIILRAILSKAKNVSMLLSIKLENNNLILTEGFGVVCEVRKNLFLNRSYKTDKCQFLNLGSHFSERFLLGVCFVQFLQTYLSVQQLCFRDSH